MPIAKTGLPVNHGNRGLGQLVYAVDALSVCLEAIGFRDPRQSHGRNYL